MYDEIPSKSCIKMKKVINREKKSKTLNEVKPVENINKNMHSFPEIHPTQKEALSSHKLQDNAYEDPFRLKEYNPSQRNCKNQLSDPSLSDIGQEYQKSLIQGKIHI